MPCSVRNPHSPQALGALQHQQCCWTDLSNGCGPGTDEAVLSSDVCTALDKEELPTLLSQGGGGAGARPVDEAEARCPPHSSVDAAIVPKRGPVQELGHVSHDHAPVPTTEARDPA